MNSSKALGSVTFGTGDWAVRAPVPGVCIAFGCGRTAGGRAEGETTYTTATN